MEGNKRCHGWEYTKNTLTSPALGKFGRKKTIERNSVYLRFLFLNASESVAGCSVLKVLGVVCLLSFQKRKSLQRLFFRGETESLRGKFRTKAFSLLTGCFLEDRRPSSHSQDIYTHIHTGKAKKGKDYFLVFGCLKVFRFEVATNKSGFHSSLSLCLILNNFFSLSGAKGGGFCGLQMSCLWYY